MTPNPKLTMLSDYILPQNCAILKEDRKHFEIESVSDSAAFDKLQKDRDFASEETFSLLTRCILAHEYLKQLKPKWLTAIDVRGADSDDDAEFMSYYHKYYEHFYHLKSDKHKKPTSIFESQILVHNTSNTSLFPFFIFLKAKWRKYWKEQPKE